MAYVLQFNTHMSRSQYDGIIAKLKAAGAGDPPGRVYHVCYGPEGDLSVTDVWESMEQVQEFGKTLFPILAKAGIEAGVPEPASVHNIMIGA